MKYAASAFALLFFATATASAADKQACMEAASKGQDLRDKGQLVEAKKEFMVCSDSGCPGPVPTYCAKWLEETKQRMPKLVFHTFDDQDREVRGSAIRIDGNLVDAEKGPVEVNPGSHRLVVERPGSKRYEQALTVVDKEQTITVKLQADSKSVAAVAPAESPSSSSTSDAGFLPSIPFGSKIAWAVAGVGLIGFAGFGIKAKVDFDDYQSSCGSVCGSTARNDVEGTMLLADAFLTVGIIAAAIGTVIYVTSKPQPSTKAAYR